MILQEFVPTNPAAPKPKHHIRVMLYRKLTGDRVEFAGTHSVFIESGDGFAATVLAVRAAFPNCFIEDAWEVPLDYVPREQQAQLAIAA